jgi:hypothetical protein
MSLVGQSIRIPNNRERKKENKEKYFIQTHTQNLGTITFRLISFVGEGREFNPIEFSEKKRTEKTNF